MLNKTKIYCGLSYEIDKGNQIEFRLLNLLVIKKLAIELKTS